MVELVDGGSEINGAYTQVLKVLMATLPEKQLITKPLIDSTFNHGLPEGPSNSVLTIIKELLGQFVSRRGLLQNCIIYIMFVSLK